MKKALEAAPRRFLTLPILRALIQKESSSCAWFELDNKLLKQSLQKASVLMGQKEENILKLATLPNGKIAKFRFEPGQYGKLKWQYLTSDKRFFVCSSWGLGQVMGFNLIQNKPDYAIVNTVRSFALDEEGQLRRAANDFDNLLVKHKGDVFRAYCEYNGGPGGHKRKDCQTRAQEVVQLEKYFETNSD